MKKKNRISNEQLPDEELQIEDLDAEGDELSEDSPKKQFTNPIKNLTKDQFRLILKVLMAVLIVMVFVSAYMVFNVWSQYQKSINKYNELENYVTVAETEPVESTRTLVADEPAAEEEIVEEEPSLIQIDFDMDFDALSKINPDVMGWIYYEPLEISYPVVVDRGDDFYEHYAFDLEKNVAGAIFIDYACRPDLKSFNTVVYGHNMRNGTMFGSLKRLIAEPDLIKENPYFYMITKDKIFMYEIFADYTCKAGSPTYDLKMEYTKEDMQGYLDYIKETAEYKRDDFFSKPLDEDLKIATLSTCHGLHSTTRTVVHGELIEVADR